MSRYNIEFRPETQINRWHLLDPDGVVVERFSVPSAAAERLFQYETREAEVAANDEDAEPLGEVRMAFDVTCYAVIDLDTREVTSVHVMDDECRNPRLADFVGHGDEALRREVVDLAHEIFDNADFPHWEFGW